MPKNKRVFVEGKFGQIHLRISEPAAPKHPPLICLHMFPQSGRNFSKLLEAFSDDRIVIAPDFPGYGESDGPETPVGAEDYAASVWDVVDALGLAAPGQPIDLFGIHAGAKLGVEAACQRPEQVGRLVLSSAAVLSQRKVDELRKSMAHIPLDKKGTRFKTWWAILVRNQDHPSELEMSATALSEILRGGEQYHWGHMSVFTYNDRFAKALDQLDHRILLLNPNDGFHELTPRSLEFIRNGELLNRPDWSLNFVQNKTDELVPVLREFLARDLSPLTQAA